MDKYINKESNPMFAFNVWNVETAIPVIDAASEGNQDVILQTSQKAYKRLHKTEFQQYVKSYSRKKNINVWLHLDHCKDLDLIRNAINNHWDSVMIDASEKDLRENIELTEKVVNMAHEKGILVESEIGQINGTEDDEKISKGMLASIESVKKMLGTKVDMLAPAIGTAHGSYKENPRLHYNIIEEIGFISKIPVVIHGGSGLTAKELNQLLSFSNVKKINISTEIKLAYLEGILNCQRLGELKMEDFDGIKISNSIYSSIKKMVSEKIKLLNVYSLHEKKVVI